MVPVGFGVTHLMKTKVSDTASMVGSTCAEWEPSSATAGLAIISIRPKAATTIAMFGRSFFVEAMDELLRVWS
jgi:hypothetical protein